MGLFFKRAWSRLFLLSTLWMGLGACLDRSLPVTATKESETDSLLSAQEESGSTTPSEAQRRATLESLREAIFKNNAAGDTSLEELIRLLREMNESPRESALSMDELRTLQTLILDSGAALLQTLRPSTSQADNPLDEPEVFELTDPTSCPSPSYEVKTLPSGLRVIAGLPRQDPCSLRLSKTYQDLLNRLLRGEKTKYVYRSQTYESQTLKDFFYTLEKLGFEIHISYRTYLAPFVRLYKPEGDPYLPDSEIALPLWLKPGVSTSDAQEVVLPAPHSEIFFRIQATRTEPEAQVKIYFSDKGFVFDDEDLVLPHWSGLRTLEQISGSERTKLFSILAELHQTFEIFKAHAPKNLPLGGFGLLGVCNDGSVLAMKGLRGSSFLAPFPLVRTDRIKMPDQYPLKDLWESTPSDTWKNSRIPRATMIERIQRGNPFVGRENPFAVFRDTLRQLDAEKASP